MKVSRSFGGRVARVLTYGVVLALPAVALAVPPDMAAIEFPITLSSIALAIVGAGVACLLIVIGPKVAFGLVKRVARALTRSVGPG